jgi:hypothetical protein
MVTSVFLTSWLAAAAMSPLPPIQAGLSATFDIPVALTLNEPVRVTMRVRNLLNEPVKFDLGWNRTQGLAFVVRGPDGGVHKPTITPSGVGRIGRIELAPQTEYSQPLVLNDWMAFDRPGSYQVEIRFTTRFVSASGAVVDGPPSETLTLEIRPRDVAILEHTYGELVDAYLSTIGEQRWYAAQVLRHLNDPVAVPMLRRILDATELDDSIVLDTLRRIGTPAAVGVLHQMAASDSADRAAMAKSVLERLRLGR